MATKEIKQINKNNLRTWPVVSSFRVFVAKLVSVQQAFLSLKKPAQLRRWVNALSPKKSGRSFFACLRLGVHTNELTQPPPATAKAESKPSLFNFWKSLSVDVTEINIDSILPILT
jgi:hypothetical protein